MFSFILEHWGSSFEVRDDFPNLLHAHRTAERLSYVLSPRNEKPCRGQGDEAAPYVFGILGGLAWEMVQGSSQNSFQMFSNLSFFCSAFQCFQFSPITFDGATQGGPILKPTWVMTDLPGGEQLAVKMTKDLKSQVVRKLEKKSKFFNIKKKNGKTSVSGTKNLALTATWPAHFCQRVAQIWLEAWGCLASLLCAVLPMWARRFPLRAFGMKGHFFVSRVQLSSAFFVLCSYGFHFRLRGSCSKPGPASDC